MTASPIHDCPDAVRAYLALAAGEDRIAATPLFAVDAHVVDDGRDYIGTAGIREWLGRVASEYTYTTTPVSARHDAATAATTVTCRIEGNFPGGVADLDYRFILDDTGRVSNLEIAPTAQIAESA